MYIPFDSMDYMEKATEVFKSLYLNEKDLAKCLNCFEHFYNAFKNEDDEEVKEMCIGTFETFYYTFTVHILCKGVALESCRDYSM